MASTEETTNESGNGKKPFSFGWAAIFAFAGFILVVAYKSMDSTIESLMVIGVCIFGVVVVLLRAGLFEREIIAGLFVSAAMVTVGFGGYQGYGYIQAKIPTATPPSCESNPVKIEAAMEYVSSADKITIQYWETNGVREVQELYPGQSYWLEVGTFVYSFNSACRGYLDTIYYPLIEQQGGKVIARTVATQTPASVPATPTKVKKNEQELTPVP